MFRFILFFIFRAFDLKKKFVYLHKTAMTHLWKILSGLNCWGKLLSWYFILFFYSFFSSPLTCLIRSLSASFLFAFELKRATRRLVRQVMAVLSSWYKRGRVSIPIRSREPTTGVEGWKGKGEGGCATWYMRIASTSKPKGNTSALLISDMLEVPYITAC